MEKRGLINVYECGACDKEKEIVTINLCAGVTPASVSCPFCGNLMGMWSRWYNLSRYRYLNPLQVTHAWYRPRSGDGLDPATLDHLQHGGLILAPLAEAVREALASIEPTGEEWEDWRPWLEARFGKAHP